MTKGQTAKGVGTVQVEGQETPGLRVWYLRRDLHHLYEKRGYKFRPSVLIFKHGGKMLRAGNERTRERYTKGVTLHYSLGKGKR